MTEQTQPGLDAQAALRTENEALRRRAESAARSNASAVEMLVRLEKMRADLERANGELREQKEHLAQALEAARAGERSKSAFLAAVSHELRTPLNAIIGYSELIAELAAERNAPEFGDDAKKIRSSGHRLLTLVNDVLDLAKVEAGRMTLVVSTFRAEALVREVEEELRPVAVSSGDRLLSCCDGTVGRVTTDRLRMHQVLTNLLGNAFKFTREGQVAVTVGRESKGGRDWVEWMVSDTGIGIAPEDQERIFDAFAQVDASRSRNHTGTGLGLAICRKICERMGGTLTVESEPGKGSIFTARIPDPVLD
ncbi:MAG: HAMP domain-containing sensor histidine kinase [Bryobacteraceae bacterium]